MNNWKWYHYGVMILAIAAWSFVIVDSHRARQRRAEVRQARHDTLMAKIHEIRLLTDSIINHR